LENQWKIFAIAGISIAIIGVSLSSIYAQQSYTNQDFGNWLTFLIDNEIIQVPKINALQVLNIELEGQKDDLIKENSNLKIQLEGFLIPPPSPTPKTTQPNTIDFDCVQEFEQYGSFPKIDANYNREKGLIFGELQFWDDRHTSIPISADAYYCLYRGDSEPDENNKKILLSEGRLDIAEENFRTFGNAFSGEIFYHNYQFDVGDLQRDSYVWEDGKNYTLPSTFYHLEIKGIVRGAFEFSNSINIFEQEGVISADKLPKEGLSDVTCSKSELPKTIVEVMGNYTNGPTYQDMIVLEVILSSETGISYHSSKDYGITDIGSYETQEFSKYFYGWEENWKPFDSCKVEVSCNKDCSYFD